MLEQREMMSDAVSSASEAVKKLTKDCTDDNGDAHQQQYRTYTVYFIRHGEALHNQLEKEAQEAALSLAISQGYDPASSYVKEAVENARKAVLNSDAVEDPPLSEVGIEEAKRAKLDLERLIDSYNLPQVEEVWVSPLQRAMKTAAIIFRRSSATCLTDKSTDANRETDNSENTTSTTIKAPRIRVMKELEERRTGLACDTHGPLEMIQKRPTFNIFSISSLKMSLMFADTTPLGSLDEDNAVAHDHVIRDITKRDSNIDICGTYLSRLSSHMGNNDDPWEQLVDIDVLSDTQQLDAASIHTSSDHSADSQDDNNKHEGVEKDRDLHVSEENKAMLRERTKLLLNLLVESKSRSIALIGHKGYLRELERGPLGHIDAALFQNGECRVYRLQLDLGAEAVGDSLNGSTVGSLYSTGSAPVVQRAEKIASSHDDVE